MKRYSKEIREEVLKIRSGRKVMDVSKEHGINDMTIRTWLERDVDGSQTLEMSRLRRENESLLRLVGQLTYESDLMKKFGLKPARRAGVPKKPDDVGRESAEYRNILGYYRQYRQIQSGQAILRSSLLMGALYIFVPLLMFSLERCLDLISRENMMLDL
jgi:transposase-like protein